MLCIDAARVFGVTWKGQGCQTFVIDCEAKAHLVWPGTLKDRALCSVEDCIVDLEHVQHDIGGKRGNIFFGDLRRGNRTISVDGDGEGRNGMEHAIADSCRK